MPSTGRILLMVVAVVTGLGAFVADWNETHIYNDRWPPHAKFHNGQTMSMGLLLGLSASYYLLRSPRSPRVEQESLYFTTWLLSIYWITQLSAALYPGTLPMDPEFGDGFPQAYICAVLFLLIGAGYALESRRLGQLKVE